MMLMSGDSKQLWPPSGDYLIPIVYLYNNQQKQKTNIIQLSIR